MKEDKNFLQVIDTINKKYGENSIFNLTEDYQESIKKVSTGLPSLDMVLGGGIPEGRIIEIFGLESSGKTTLALQILAQCQKTYLDRRIAFLDIENALDPEYAKKIGIKKIDEMYISQPNSGEEALDIAEKLAQSNAFSCIVVDSVSNLVPQAVAAKEIDGTANIGTTARLMSQTLPRLSNAIRKSNTILIFINQIRMKIGVMWGNPETTTGGLALKFNASQRIEIRGRKAEERNGREGIPVKITIKKNKIAPPFRQTETFLIFGEGFSVIDDVIETAIAKNIIQKSGGWFVYDKIKSHGMESLRNEILNDEKIKNKILQEVNKK